MSGFAASGWPRIALCGAAVLLWSPLAASPADVVRDCAQKAAPEVSGIKALDAACPGLQGALEELGLIPMQIDGWQGRMNAHGLLDLASLAESYGGSKPGKSPDRAALAAILKTLEHEQAQPTKTWWDAFRAWLDRHFDVLASLDRLMDRIEQSTTLFHVIAYSLVALILAAATAVVVNEFKAQAAGRRRGVGAAASRKVDLDQASAGSAAAEPGTLAEKLTALLRDLVTRLVNTGRLTQERSLTHRELVVRSHFDNESQRAAFAGVAGAAEAIVYGPHGALGERLNAALADGRTLLAQISDPPSGH